MDLTRLANLGEFIGGVAVLVTLVYLALQVRQNTRQSLGTLQYTMLTDHSRLLESTRGNPTHAALIVKTSDGEPLDAVEEVLFQADVELFLNHWMGVQQAFDLGLVGESFFQTFCDDVKRSLDAAPAFRRYARQNLGAYPEISGMKIYAPIFEEGEKQGGSGVVSRIRSAKGVPPDQRRP